MYKFENGVEYISQHIFGSRDGFRYICLQFFCILLPNGFVVNNRQENLDRKQIAENYPKKFRYALHSAYSPNGGYIYEKSFVWFVEKFPEQNVSAHGLLRNRSGVDGTGAG